jgi:hypothetical protein
MLHTLDTGIVSNTDDKDHSWRLPSPAVSAKGVPEGIKMARIVMAVEIILN